MDNKPLRVFTGLESIRQAAYGMRAPLAVAFPCDFGARAPQFGALIERCIRYDEPVVVIQIGHS